MKAIDFLFILNILQALFIFFMSYSHNALCKENKQLKKELKENEKKIILGLTPSASLLR